jgi:hypothetical protein
MDNIFTLDITLDNAAFEDDPCMEIARILRETADKVERGKHDGRTMDYNGNGVGKYGIS